MVHYTLLLGHETCWHVDAPVLCKQDSSLNKLIAGKRRRKKNGVGVMISLLGSRCFLSLPLHCHNCFQLDSSDLHTPRQNRWCWWKEMGSIREEQSAAVSGHHDVVTYIFLARRPSWLFGYSLLVCPTSVALLPLELSSFGVPTELMEPLRLLWAVPTGHLLRFLSLLIRVTAQHFCGCDIRVNEERE
jgi:hypothetical protein